MGEEGRVGSGRKKRARWSFGEEEIVWWNARETLWAKRRSRWGRFVRICSRSSGRWKVRVAAVGCTWSDMFFEWFVGSHWKVREDSVCWPDILESSAELLSRPLATQKSLT